jgi:hypothetical protein
VSSSSTTRPRVKPRLSFRLVPGLPGEPLMLEVMEQTPRTLKFFWYYVSPIGGTYAPAWALTKSACTDGTDPEECCYEVLCEGGAYSCSCKGHLRHGRCKHADGIRHVRQEGGLS